MALPLFRLPMIVIKLVLDIMGFIDIFCQKLGSRSAEHIFLSETGNNQMRNLFHLKIGTIDHVPVEVFEGRSGANFLTIYLSRSIQHGTVLYSALVEIFGMPSWGYRIYLDDATVETHRNWINWINETLPVPHNIVIAGECSFLDYVWMVENVRTENALVLNVKSTDYSANFESLNVNFTFKAEVMCITDGRWIKMKHFQSIEAQQITIWKVSLTDSELNTYLKDWKNSKDANLKLMALYFDREPDPVVVFEGIDATDEDQLKPNDARNQWSFKLANDEKCTVISSLYMVVDGWEIGYEFEVGN